MSLIFLDEGASPYVYMFADDVLVTELSDLDILSDTTLCAGDVWVLNAPGGTILTCGIPG